MAAGATMSLDGNSTYLPRPYTIDVNQSFIEDIRQKASSFRPSLDIRQPAWTDGPPSSKVMSLARYWAEEYDWAAVQSRINAEFDHYMMTVPAPGEGYNSTLDIHFIHQRSPREDAIPMLMLHGWPSTSLEWEKVIPDLVEPKDPSHPAFHIVAPDLPGYGFSPAPTAPGLGPSEHAIVFASLMQQLGFERYAVYSTDLGFVVGRSMVAEHGIHIVNHVTDLYLAQANATDLARYSSNETTAEETRYIESNSAFFTNYGAYASLHSTLPLSVAYALNDSPVGFLAWMYQLVYTVSDNSYTPSELITQALLLYLPGVYGNIRSYKELFPSLASLTAYRAEKPEVPTSVLQFGGFTSYPGLQSLNYAPRDWAERSANVTFFARHDVGGHFPALSAPQLVLEDIWAIFAQ
ncbi:hypothetical protein LTR37_009847 [Vermiconidia calcicola]|uniref:Uncharacterized protein n=1 Tax=Vermiconidia calcicola TaxID=1690605 RepID=A0ACC3N6Y9_9PEZI|nr:hypothetical protein LTR37_009847 [Vermiconidia calcicola]